MMTQGAAQHSGRQIGMTCNNIEKIFGCQGKYFTHRRPAFLSALLLGPGPPLRRVGGAEVLALGAQLGLPGLHVLLVLREQISCNGGHTEHILDRLVEVVYLEDRTLGARLHSWWE